nr:amino acid ABC transporter permease [Paenibacillus shirakamiensis]
MKRSLPLYYEAMCLTLQLAGLSIVCSLFVGLILSIALHFKWKGISLIIQAYIELSRNTPLLVQLYFLYYGLPKIGLPLSEMSCAIIGLTFLGGSYMTEAFRSGFESVGRIQLESGLSIGLSRAQLIRHVILPQAFSTSIPSLSANAIFLLKETSIVGAISLMDLMNVAKDLIGMEYKSTEALLLLVLAYLILLLPLSMGLTWLERRIRFAEFGR